MCSGLGAALLCAACSHSTPTQAVQPPTIDVLDFLIGTPSLWPRVGNHSQNQFVDFVNREVCWVKYGNPRTFECWRWDDAFVYHEVDHAIDGNTGESYRFSDGRWMPRHFSGTWSLDVSGNRITWFDPSCGVEPRSGIFPYRLRVWVDPGRDAGPDLGVRETLVLEYQPYDPVGAVGAAEHFYFARQAGWYEWERSGFHDMFNRVGGPARSPLRDVICP